MTTTSFKDGTVIRLRDGATGIVLTIDARPRLFTGAELRVILADEVRENPAVCPSCGASTWWWEMNIVPQCRVCDPPSSEWLGALFGRALKAVAACPTPDGRKAMEQAFADWDIDRLLNIVNFQMLRDRLLSAPVKGIRA